MTPTVRLADAPDLLTARDLAGLFSVHIRTVRRWQAEGKLPRPVKIGRVVRWQKSDLQMFLALQIVPQ